MKTYSCIIPFYNEELRIFGVLNAISQVPEIKQIICVDDGSTDNSAGIIKNNFPGVVLIRNTRNLGKTEAVRNGLRSATHDDILLMDADLVDGTSQDIKNALHAFEKYDLDCLLLNTKPVNTAEFFLRPFCRFLLLAAGSRIVHKPWLSEVLRNPYVTTYDLEIAQNKYLWDHNMSVAYMDVAARNIGKIDKVGWVKGLIDELVMWHRIVTYAGVVFFIQQTLFFARRKVNTR